MTMVIFPFDLRELNDKNDFGKKRNSTLMCAPEIARYRDPLLLKGYCGLFPLRKSEGSVVCPALNEWKAL